MKNILITAGGTIEPIDKVRSITNTGTGRLGSLIADSFSKAPSVNKIFYICAHNTISPMSDKVAVIYIESVNDLQAAVIETIENHKIDVVIHSMAVSDYRVKAVSSVEALAEELNTKLQEQELLEENVKEIILRGFDSNDLVKDTGKMSSQINSPIILLEQTPKILPMFKKLLPKSIVVGFKLLSQVSEEKLLGVAHRLLIENECDYVLANDTSDITGDQHKGFLIDKNRSIKTFYTKQEIAAGIVAAILERI